MSHRDFVSTNQKFVLEPAAHVVNEELLARLMKILSEAGAEEPYELSVFGSPDELAVYLSDYQPSSEPPDYRPTTRVGDTLVQIIGIPVAIAVLIVLTALESPPVP